MSASHDASINHLREMILGRSGPYADPRDAIDSLDNIQFWLSQLMPLRNRPPCIAAPFSQGR